MSVKYHLEFLSLKEDAQVRLSLHLSKCHRWKSYVAAQFNSPICALLFQAAQMYISLFLVSGLVIASLGSPTEMGCLDLCIEAIYSCDATCTLKPNSSYVRNECLKRCGTQYLSCTRSCRLDKVAYFRRPL